MKVRDSGMPEEDVWQSFFDAGAILDGLTIEAPNADIVEFGCGYGTFTAAVAKRTSGTVFAIDLEPEMIEATKHKTVRAGLTNVTTICRDFVLEGTGLPDAVVDCALLFNILHCSEPVRLLRESFRVLRPVGKVAAIHWIAEDTPRGPDLSIRPLPEQIRQWLLDAGFEIVIEPLALPPYHFGIVGRKPV